MIVPSDPLEHDKDSSQLKQELKEPIKEEVDSPDKSLPDQEDLPARLLRLQERNRTLKRTKQMKTVQLRQLTTESKSNTACKFNKCLMTLIAFRMEEHEREQVKGRADRVEGRSLLGMNKIIEHIMDSSRPKLFREYIDQFNQLMRMDSL